MMIGKLAEISRTGIETIRFYEKRGLLQPLKRRASGYRVYDDGAIRRLEFIHKAKDLGFSLDEIKDLLSIKIQKKAQCKSVKSKAQKKLETTRGKIDGLLRIATVLEELIECCNDQEPTSECPILDCLEGKCS